MRFAALLLILNFFFLTLFPAQTHAAEFEQSFIKLSRLKAGSTTGGLICATPQSGGVENKVLVNFPNNFTINSTAANWTVTTTNLPSGATPWPGIATATSVSGGLVTFPSNDLTTSTQYCFRFSETNTLTNPVAGHYNVQLSTQNNASLTIDSSEQGITILDDDQITVSASTNATAADIQNQLSSNVSSRISQDTNITYQITYGNRSTVPVAMSIEASWTRGTMVGDTEPSVEILSYQYNTATVGYNDAVPIIDLNNRKIIWNVGTIPANTTGLTVNFILKTFDNYKGDKKISFNTSSQITTPTLTTDKSTVFTEYQYIPPTSASSTPTSNPQPPTPTPTVTRPIISSVEITDISPNSVTIKLSGENISSLTIYYGTNPKNLTGVLKIPKFVNNAPIEIKDLEPNTSYYFQIRAFSQNNQLLISDIFYIPTSSKDIDRDNPLETLTITSLSNILYGGGAKTNGLFNQIILSEDSIFEFKLKLKEQLDIKQIAVFLKPKLNTNQVLSITTANAAEFVGATATLNEISIGNFFGRLRTPQTSGSYEVIAKIADYSGNLFDLRIFDVYAVKPISVYSTDKKPIEGARVYLYSLNPKEKIYLPLTPQVLNLTNPSYTDPHGYLNLNLPAGKYRIEVLAIGFKDQTADFEITSNQSENYYPQIYLEKDPEFLLNFIRYYSRIAQDLFDLSKKAFSDLSLSNRLFDFLVFVILSLFVLGSWVALIAKLKIPFLQFPRVIYERVTCLLNKDKEYCPININLSEIKSTELSNTTLVLKNSKGIVIDEKKLSSKEELLTFPKLPIGNYSLELIKEGERQRNIDFHHYSNKPLKISLNQFLAPGPIQKIGYLILELIGLSFEFLLILSLILEFAFIYSFGFFRILPFFILTVANMLIFIQFVRLNNE